MPNSAIPQVNWARLLALEKPGDTAESNAVSRVPFSLLPHP